MYDTLWNIIQSGDYDLPGMTRKIDVFYAEGKINDDQRADLMAQAVEHADPERERPDWAEMVERLAERVTALEARLDAGAVGRAERPVCQGRQGGARRQDVGEPCG